MIMNKLEDVIFEDLELDKPLDNTDAPTNTDLTEEDFFTDTVTDVPAEDSIISELLKARGISDGKITIIDEDNKESEVNFSELSKEEQLEILNDYPETEDNELDESEIGFINQIREKNQSIEEFLEDYKQEILATLDESTTQNYDIDAYDDKELYLLDLKNKYDLTDEELVKELEKELKDENLFKKKVDVLRAEYKQLEDQYKETQKLEFAEKQQEEYNQFAQKMVDVALETPEFYGIELEDDEKNEVLSFLLDLDDKGTSEFSKSLNDPKKLYEAAWFLRYGKESFDALKNAYESEIAKLKKDPKQVVVRRDNTKTQDSIHDLF